MSDRRPSPREWVKEKYGVTLSPARAAMVYNRAMNPTFLAGATIEQFIQQMVQEQQKEDAVTSAAQSMATGKPLTPDQRNALNGTQEPPVTEIPVPKPMPYAPKLQQEASLHLPPKKLTNRNILYQLRWLGVRDLADVEDKYELLARIYNQEDLDALLEISQRGARLAERMGEIQATLMGIYEAQRQFDKLLRDRDKGRTRKERNWQNFYDEVWSVLSGSVTMGDYSDKDYGESLADSGLKEWSSYMHYYWRRLGSALGASEPVKRNVVPSADFFLHIFEKLYESYSDAERLANLISKVAAGDSKTRRIRRYVCMDEQCMWEGRSDREVCPKCGSPLQVKIEYVDAESVRVNIEPAIGMDDAQQMYAAALDAQLTELQYELEEIQAKVGVEDEVEEITLDVMLGLVSQDLNRPINIRGDGYIAFVMHLMRHKKITTASVRLPGNNSVVEIGRKFLKREPGGYMFRVGQPKAAVYRMDGVYIEITPTSQGAVANFKR